MWGDEKSKDNFLDSIMLCGALMEMRNVSKGVQMKESIFEHVDSLFSKKHSVAMLRRYLSKWVLSTLYGSRKNMEILKALAYNTISGNLTNRNGYNYLVNEKRTWNTALRKSHIQDLA